MSKLYTVRKLKLGRSDQLDALALAAGELYSRTLTAFWRVVRRKDLWLGPAHLMRWHNSAALHAHSADAVTQSFFAALASWRVRRKVDPRAKPPKRRRKFYRVQWKSSAIRLKDGQLRLSNGKGNAPLCIPWKQERVDAQGVPKQIEIGWDGAQYELRAVYILAQTTQASTMPVGDQARQPLDPKTAGVDLGEIHPAAAHDGVHCTIANGRVLRSKRRYQNKLKAELSARIDIKKRGSRRRRRLVRSKRRQLGKLDNQIHDILHKQTTKLVSTLQQAGVQTVVIGDVREIRQDLDYGHKANQRIHQMLHGKTRHMITYKAWRRGMQVELQDEAYTTQTCPRCGKRYKPRGRDYKCRRCGLVYHRDGVGAWNIRQKYLGCGPVVGAMAPPIGQRYTSHARCSSSVVAS